MGDADGDGTADRDDPCPAVPGPHGDGDGDGVGDGCDVCPEVAEVAGNHTDRDGDGQPTCAGDCDDTNPRRAAGLRELCDGIDNDCDLEVDEACEALPDGGTFPDAAVPPDAGGVRPACDDGVDNDQDGHVDLDDPGCVDAIDDDERDEPLGQGVCSDGEDNDRDGLTDFPEDGDCEGPADPSEAGTSCPVQGAPGWIPSFGGHDVWFELNNVPAGRYWIFVDNDFGWPGWTTVRVSVRAR